MARHAALVLLFLAFTVGAAQPASAYTSSRAYPVVLVHGYKPGVGVTCPGYDLSQYWYYVKQTLQQYLGWSGGVVGLKFYTCDINYDASLDGHGSHSTHWPSGHYLGSHTRDADIRHLSYHLAWYIYDNYTSLGVNVQLIGHSMGGLIIRMMLKEFQAGDPDYPPALYVQDAVTWGTPHNGAGDCATPLENTLQALQFCVGSTFIADLNTNLNPQASLGTDWTTVASEADTALTVSSALYMSPVHRVDYLCLTPPPPAPTPACPVPKHSDFVADRSLIDDATVYRSDGGGAVTQQTNQSHTIKWADKALFLISW